MYVCVIKNKQLSPLQKWACVLQSTNEECNKSEPEHIPYGRVHSACLQMKRECLTVFLEFVPIAHCTLQSLTWLQYWNGGVSHDYEVHVTWDSMVSMLKSCEWLQCAMCNRDWKLWNDCITKVYHILPQSDSNPNINTKPRSPFRVMRFILESTQ